MYFRSPILAIKKKNYSAMGIDARTKEKQEIVKRYFDAERKLILADEEISRLNSEIETLRNESERKDEKIQTLLSHING